MGWHELTTGLGRARLKRSLPWRHSMNTPIAGTETSWRTPAQALRWNAVFAGMAVGIAVHLLVSMLGGAAGLALSGASPGGGQPAAVPVPAGVWSAGSLVVAAMAGGYVA